MAKKRVARKKTSSRKKSAKRKSPAAPHVHEAKHHGTKSISHRASHIGESNTEKILIENFVSLQKVMVNLSVKFDNLSSQISKLLDLFEISAKVLAEKGAEMGGDNKELVKRIDNILEQNKLIARGVTLMHEGRETRGPPSMEMQPSVMQRARPQNQSTPQRPPIEKRTIEQDEIGNPGVSPSKFKLLPKE